MKQLKILVLIFLSFLNFSLISGPLDIIGSDFSSIFVSEIAEKQKILEGLKSEKEKLEADYKKFNDWYKDRVDESRAKIATSKPSSTNHAITKKISLLNKFIQVLSDLKDARKKVVEIVSQHIDFLTEYFKDLEKLKSSEPFEKKSLYRFKDLQDITKDIAKAEEHARKLSLDKDDIHSVISRNEHQVTEKTRKISSIEKEIDDLKKQSAEDGDIRAEVENLDIEKDITSKEREVEEVHLIVQNQEIRLVDSRSSVVNERLKKLNESSSIVRQNIRIDRAEVQEYEVKNQEVRHEAESKKNALIEEKNKALAEKKKQQDELDRIRNRYNISISDKKQIERWDIEAIDIAGKYSVCLVAKANVILQSVEKRLEKITAEIAVQDAKMEHSKILFDTVNLLFSVVNKHEKDSDSVEKEHSFFKEKKKSLIADMKKYGNDSKSVHAFIQSQHDIIFNIKKELNSIEDQPATGSSLQQKKSAAIDALKISRKEKEFQEQNALDLSKIYSALKDIKEETLENVKFVLQEYDHAAVWHRAASAITWDRLKDVIPNFKIFLVGIWRTFSSYIMNFSIKSVAFEVSKLTITQFFIFFFFFFFAFILFIVVQTFLPTLYRALMTTDDLQYSLFVLSQVGAILVGTLRDTFKLFYWWSIFLLTSYFFEFALPVSILLAITSMVLCVYFSRIFLYHFLFINRKSDYVLSGKKFVSRFSFVFSFFSISTIIILFLRKMSTLVVHGQNYEFSNILLWVLHIIIFVSIILLVDKNDLVKLISEKSKAGEKISALIDRYYYIFAIFVFGLIVMSDPYLGGYGSLVWVGLWNSLFSLMILILFFLLHKVIREYSQGFFFQENDLSGASAERFENAKTWYGFYVILLFLIFSLFSVISCANIWGYGVNLDTLTSLLYYEITKIQTDSGLVGIQVLDLLRLILAPFFGVFFAYIFRKFVLDKIFEIHYVDPGVQNTVIVISRYLIIFSFSMVGLAQAGFGNQVQYILMGGTIAIVYFFKDLFSDSVAYFFILVQRPLKLGDFVKIDSNTMGVVRGINSRAVVLRRKNAVNIVVPNSTILKSSLYNWNYTRTYVGFNDIVFCVPFDSDVVLVRDILLKILDEHPDVLKVPQPVVRLEDFTDKGFQFTVRGFLSSGNTLRQWDIASGIRFQMIEKLRAQGIKIAPPSLEILMHNKKELKLLENNEQK